MAVRGRKGGGVSTRLDCMGRMAVKWLVSLSDNDGSSATYFENVVDNNLFWLYRLGIPKTGERTVMLKNFESEEFGSLKTFQDEEGREFFRAIDVCYALKLGNPSQSLKRYVSPKYVVKIKDDSNKRGNTQANYVSEPGLYQLIFASKTESAEKFQEWVFEKVLPKLRSRGAYVIPTATVEQLHVLEIEVCDLIAEKAQLAGEMNVASLKLDEARATIAQFKYGSSGWEKRMRLPNRLKAGVQVGC
jgi:prophage antirepressor-like protein